MATSRSSSGSRAAHTSPMPPRPSKRVSVKRPSCRPTAAAGSGETERGAALAASIPGVALSSAIMRRHVSHESTWLESPAASPAGIIRAANRISTSSDGQP